MGVSIDGIFTGGHAEQATYGSKIPINGPALGATKRKSYLTGAETESVTVYESTSREGDMDQIA